MPEEPRRIFKCPTCNILWVRHQLVEAQTKKGKIVMVCCQDGAEVEDITETPRGKRFAQLYQSWEEGKNADQI